MGVAKEETKNRLGSFNYNKDGYIMEVIKYIASDNVIVKFNDKDDTTVKTTWYRFINGKVKNPNHIKNSRLNMINKNRFGSYMKCIEYIDSNHIIVQFQDEYQAKVSTSWAKFVSGEVRNPYDTSFYDVGIIGEKYPITINGKRSKEIILWMHILERGFSEKFKEKHPSYKDVTVCKEWLYYPNFYEWIHEQENFDKWYKGNNWAIDKDIILKHNKIYSSNTSCLIPQYINNIFCKHEAARGEFPIGVYLDKRKNLYSARISKGKDDNVRVFHIGYYTNPEDAFYLGYKPAKENYIKQVAKEEYNKGNITKKCYEAMMKYEVEITD